ncbi:MAG: amidohydrolase [Actinomycetota bacterium]
MTTTLFFNGTIRTVTEDTGVEWVMVEDDKIVGVHPSTDYVGNDPHSVGNWKRSDLPDADRRFDLQGATLVPAFRDAHVHLPATGLYELGLDFRGERSASRILSAFEGRAADSGVLFGGNFEDPLDEPLLGADIDRAVGDRKALLMRADMHSCIVSSALLDELDLADVEGVDRDADGRTTGYLREQGASEAYKWFETELPRAQQVEAIRAAVGKAYSRGIAEVHEMFVVEWRSWNSAEILQEATDGVALDVAVFFGTTEVARVKEMGLPRIGGDWFLDGSFGSHTAWLSEPYLSTPPAGSTATGIAYRDDDEVYEFFREAHAADLQVGVHAIGDAAIEQCIAAWERVAREVGDVSVIDKGHRIEHFECATDDHIARAARLRLHGSVQPAFDHYWGGENGLYSERMGWDRASGMNRFASMLRGGMTLAAGSDSTVTPLDPFLQMHSLRKHHVPSERLDPATALALHTMGPAMVSAHRSKGPIQMGAQADLAVLDRDPITTDDDELLKTEVLGTWIAGRRVWPPDVAEVG